MPGEGKLLETVGPMHRLAVSSPNEEHLSLLLARLHRQWFEIECDECFFECRNSQIRIFILEVDPRRNYSGSTMVLKELPKQAGIR